LERRHKKDFHRAYSLVIHHEKRVSYDNITLARIDIMIILVSTNMDRLVIAEVAPIPEKE